MEISKSAEKTSAKKMSFLQIVKRFFEPAISKPRRFIILSLSTLLWSTLAVFTMNIIKFVTDYITIWKSDWIYFFAILYAVILVVYYWFERYFRNNDRLFFMQTHYYLRVEYLEKLLKLDNNFYESMWTWKLWNILTTWTMNWWWQLRLITQNWMQALFTLILCIITVFIVGRIYWVGVIVFLLLWIWLFFLFQWKLNFRKKARKEIWLETAKTTTKVIMSKFEVFRENMFHKEAKKLIDILKKETWFVNNEENYAFPLQRWPWFLLKVWEILLIIFMWVGAIYWTNTLWEFVMFIWIIRLVENSATMLFQLQHQLFRDSVDIEKLREVFDNWPMMIENKEWKWFVYNKWDIKIKKTSFSYWSNKVFQNLNLTIQGWTKTAFVGESWGGKTTLIKLLAWYIRPDKWEIDIDGQKLSEIKLTDYYKHIGYLTQDPSVFDGTIYENLVYALETEPPKEDLEKVVKLAKCEFIREFEKWLETEIGERWVRLSWWQKQRLAIAKIMLKNPNIILLDEPTSALDSFNEEQISIALHNLFNGKTVIVVAHRLQTVKKADRILLFEHGKVLEEWTHDELVKLNGKYKKMLDLQSGF